MWDLIVSVPDHCLSFYFVLKNDVCSNFLNRDICISNTDICISKKITACI